MADLTGTMDVYARERRRIVATTRAQAAALIVATAVLLVGGLLAAGHLSGSVDPMLAAAVTARKQSDAAQAVLSSVKDAETGQRGFLLTGRDVYLAPYTDAHGRIAERLSNLADLARDTPWLQAEQAELDGAVQTKLGELQQTIDLSRSAGLATAIATVNTDAGRRSMDTVRAIVGRIVERADRERIQRVDMMTRRQDLVMRLLVLGMGAGIVLLGGGALLLLLSYTGLRIARTNERRESDRLQAAVEHVPDGIAVFDAEGRLAVANTRFGPSLGLPPALSCQGTPISAIAQNAALDTPALQGPRPAKGVMTESVQGKRSLEVWRSPMPDGGQIVAVADISRRVAAEEAARQSQKMDVLGQMTGGIAHDFNNLLQVVSANLELLRNRLDRLPGNAPLLARLDAAAAGVVRGARLTRHLLAFARRQPLAPEPVDAARLLMAAEDMLRRTVGEAVQLELVIGGGLWFMRADPVQFENALLNLALNARDAMTGPEGTAKGRLTIEAANASLDEAYASRSAEVSPGQYVMVAVTDTGTGMTAEQRARAIEPFYTTKPEGRGTGLGLPMVLGFAKQSGGHFVLYSEPGRGTTARLYIPRTTAPALLAEAPRSDERVVDDGQHLVLLVEDDSGVRQIARDALADLGYLVVEAESADAALALLEGGCRPRLLFTDVVMPGDVSAPALARRAKALIPGLGVLFTSGYTQNSIVHNGQLDADVALISKPWRQEDLARALRAALDGTGLRPPAPRRILLVEDEELVRMTTADALAELGFEVLEASTAAGAMGRLSPPPDLLLTDYGLPDQDGLALARLMRERLPSLPVVLSSGQSTAPAGDVVWLPKPYDVEALREAVAAALRG